TPAHRIADGGGVRSSSSTWSSLRSISSRRRRIRERPLAEVMTSQHRRKRPQPEGRGACQARASVSGADRTRPLHSAAVGEVCWFFASPTSSLSRSAYVLGFVHLRQNVETKAPQAPAPKPLR